MRGHLGHCGHGKDKPIGPGQLCAMGDGSHLNVFHSLRYQSAILKSEFLIE